ncbi:MAG: hypothetical protein V1859_03910 [archaeon]
MCNSKKGVSVYISWVILLLMVVVLGYFMYNWSVNKVKESNKDLEKITDTNLCSDVSMNVEGICQETQNLYINITNTNIVRIEKLSILIIDLYGNPETKETTIALYPGDSEESFSVLKQGSAAKKVKIIPIVLKEKQEVICYNSALETEDISFCN